MKNKYVPPGKERVIDQCLRYSLHRLKEHKDSGLQGWIRIKDIEKALKTKCPSKEKKIKINCLSGHSNGFTIGWAVKGIGFGMIDFLFSKGKIYCSNETMDKEFIKKILNHIVDKSILV